MICKKKDTSAVIAEVSFCVFMGILLIYYPFGESQSYYVMEDNMSNSKNIRVLIVEPCKAPYPAEISSGLESLQSQVGGLIQALYIDDVALICNEEGKLIGLPWNRPLFDEEGNLYDVIVGTFIVAGLTEDDFGSLSDEQIEKYTEVLRKWITPELILGGGMQ